MHCSTPNRASSITIDGHPHRIRKVSRYSVSFQDHGTEVTPLLARHIPAPHQHEASRFSYSRLGGSLRDLRAAQALMVNGGDDDDEELSECEGVGIVGHSRSYCSSNQGGLSRTAADSSINYQQEDQQESGNRSFSDGAAILQYTAQGDVGGAASSMRLCEHGKNYDTCCGKPDVTTAGIPNGHSPDTEIRDGTEVGHCHDSAYREVDKKARRRLLIASALCLVFMVGEVIGGYLAGSLAIMTDAAHLLTDFASFMISLFALFVAARPPTKRMSFGWYRAEVIGALTSVIMIWVVTGILVFLAVQRIISEDYEIDALIMLITSGVGVGVNIIMGMTLHTHGHSHGGGSAHGHSHDAKPKKSDAKKHSTSKDAHGHSHEAHGHSHDYGTSNHDHDNNDHGHSHSHDSGVVDRQAEEGIASHGRHTEQNINVRAAYIHVIGDFIQSIGVFLAALTIYFKPEWQIVDPICTFLFSILVLLTTFAIMKDTLMVLMEGLPKGVDFNDVHRTFFSIQGVVQVHNLRIWSLSMDKVALSAHVVINPGINPRDILKEASRIVRNKYSFFEMTLQIEDMKEEMANCEECLGPAK